MTTKEITAEQLLSMFKQKSYKMAGKQKEADFLDEAITLLTIDRCINNLTNWENIPPSDIKAFKESWRLLMQKVQFNGLPFPIKMSGSKKRKSN